MFWPGYKRDKDSWCLRTGSHEEKLARARNDPDYQSAIAIYAAFFLARIALLNDRHPPEAPELNVLSKRLIEMYASEMFVRLP